MRFIFSMFISIVTVVVQLQIIFLFLQLQWEYSAKLESCCKTWKLFTVLLLPYLEVLESHEGVRNRKNKPERICV